MLLYTIMNHISFLMCEITKICNLRGKTVIYTTNFGNLGNTVISNGIGNIVLLYWKNGRLLIRGK